MNLKQIGIAAVVVAILAGAIYFLKSNRTGNFASSTGGKMGEKVFEQFPLNDIANIVVTTSDGALHLKRDGGKWQVEERGYAADRAKIDDLLKKVWDLKITQTEQVGPSHRGRLKLLEPGADGAEKDETGTKVEFLKEDGSAAATMVLGSEIKGQEEFAASRGRRIRTGNSENLVLLVSEAFSQLQAAAPKDWLNKDFIKVQKLASVEVAHENPEDSWKVERDKENGPLKFADPKPGEELDTAKSSGIGTLFSYASFDDVAPADTKLENPTKVTVTTFDNFTYNIEIAPEPKKEGDTGEDSEGAPGVPPSGNYYMTVSVSADIPDEPPAEPTAAGAQGVEGEKGEAAAAETEPAPAEDAASADAAASSEGSAPADAAPAADAPIPAPAPEGEADPAPDAPTPTADVKPDAPVPAETAPAEATPAPAPDAAAEPAKPKEETEEEKKAREEEEKKAREEAEKQRKEEWETKKKELKEKLTTEKALEGRVFIVTSWTVQNALKKRSELIKTEATPEGAKGPDALRPPTPGGIQPGATAVTPPIKITPGAGSDKGKIIATTPPVTVDPEQFKKREEMKVKEAEEAAKETASPAPAGETPAPASTPEGAPPVPKAPEGEAPQN